MKKRIIALILVSGMLLGFGKNVYRSAITISNMRNKTLITVDYILLHTNENILNTIDPPPIK